MPEFKTNADFTSTASDTGSSPPSFSLEDEIRALELTPNLAKARAMAASLAASSVGPFAGPEVAARLNAARLRVGKLVSG